MSAHTTVNGHTFDPYHYAGMGNTERQCSRCGFRQDEQTPDEKVPACPDPAPDKCGSRLTVTIVRTTYEMVCCLEPDHDGDHRSPVGSTWMARPPRKPE